MKTSLILLVCLLLANGLSAQNSANDKQLKKEQKKALRDSVDNAEYQLTKNMIDSMGFVLEAYYLFDKTGVRVPVNSTINFIKVDSSQTVIQTGSNRGAGANGIGGTTAEGKITQWKVSKDKKHKSFNVTMEVTTNIGMYSVFLDVASSGRANARLTGLWPGQLNWEGQLVPLSMTRTYKGRSM